MPIVHIEHKDQYLGEVELDQGLVFEGPDAPASAVMRRIADDVTVATSLGLGRWRLTPAILEASPEAFALDVDPDDTIPFVPAARPE